MYSSAARTNLTSDRVTVHRSDIVGEGQFRIAYAGTYLNGNRKNQEAVCKSFKSKYKVIEQEFFDTDDRVNERAIQFAEDWNDICPQGKDIQITYGTVSYLNDGNSYLIEPLIRYFQKFTSNNGWIANENDVGWAVLAMEAFSHFTYHRSGGQMIVCDLQGRYRFDRYNRNKCRFELTDVAICSRQKRFGVTDLGEKGIESFFYNHRCNKFCHCNGTWSSPRMQRNWFDSHSGTSMMASSDAYLLETRNQARFTSSLQPIYDHYDDSSDDDSW